MRVAAGIGSENRTEISVKPLKNAVKMLEKNAFCIDKIGNVWHNKDKHGVVNHAVLSMVILHGFYKAAKIAATGYDGGQNGW